MHDPYAPTSRTTLDPFPEARLREVGADDDHVRYWRAVVASLDDDARDELYGDWHELSDDELARDVLGNVEELPDPEEVATEYDDVPTLVDVPRNARDVVAWLTSARGDDQRLRAELAHEVEQQRATQRVSVLDAVSEVLRA